MHPSFFWRGAGYVSLGHVVLRKLVVASLDVGGVVSDRWSGGMAGRGFGVWWVDGAWDCGGVKWREGRGRNASKSVPVRPPKYGTPDGGIGARASRLRKETFGISALAPAEEDPILEAFVAEAPRPA